MMEFYITSLLQILCFSSHFRRFEMKIFLRRPTMMADNISQLVTPPSLPAMVDYQGQALFKNNSHFKS